MSERFPAGHCTPTSSRSSAVSMVHHTGLCPADIDESLRFYRDGIGLTVLADFTMDANLEPLLGRRTSQVRAVFLGSPDSPQGGTLELLDLGAAELRQEAKGSGTPRRGVFLVSFIVDVRAVLTRLADLGLVGEPRTMKAPSGLAATVSDPDGVTVELLSGPVTQLPSG